MFDLSEYIYKHMDDEDFFEDLRCLLEQIEVTPKSVISILNAISTFDIQELYEKVLLDERLKCFLPESKVEALKQRYRTLFEASITSIF